MPLYRFFNLPAISNKFIDAKDYFLLFETGLFDKDNFTSYVFFDPIDIIKTNRYRDVPAAFEKIENYAKKYYLAGYFSYELGYYFEDFKTGVSSGYPLIHLGVFDRLICFNHKTEKININVPGLFAEREKNKDFSVRNLRLNFRKAEYVNKVNRIKDYIRRGDTYQVNLTGKFRFGFEGSAYSFYRHLKNRQNVPYGSFCKLGSEYLACLSPELFFRREGRILYSRPMKGTIKRGKDIKEDREMSLGLKNSRKDLAENLMIVDLIRNDLGRISKTGTVRVRSLFDIEKYDTLFQMTSTVGGVLREDITYFELFKNIFPGGSVTGAPKIRTMQIIRELEGTARNIYCGALGIIFPDDKAVFNLPIRTISLTDSKGEMGIGSGIVYDSDPDREFDECLLKAKFFTEEHQPFHLLESILWEGKYRFLDEHLKRIKDSADYFNFYFNCTYITKQLETAAKDFKGGCRYKVRLLLDSIGDAKIEYSKLAGEKDRKERYAAISGHRIDPCNIFRYHKTTNRKLYDSEYDYYHRKGYFDVLFLNTKNEVSEGAISNIIIEKNKRYCTPPVSSGILPGIFRDYFIKKHNAKEKPIFLKDLAAADRIFLCNSVRGLTEVKIDRKFL